MEKLIAYIEVSRLWNMIRDPIQDHELHILEMFIDLWARMLKNGFKIEEIKEIVESDVPYIGVLRYLDGLDNEILTDLLLQAVQKWADVDREVSYPW